MPAPEVPKKNLSVLERLLSVAKAWMSWDKAIKAVIRATCPKWLRRYVDPLADCLSCGAVVIDSLGAIRKHAEVAANGCNEAYAFLCSFLKAILPSNLLRSS
ncbi:hypothetical protein HK405_004345 [Cladochytrium tenue]|nr:hypothetical protein HK405_004345 [Cladochytrium tenue]